MSASPRRSARSTLVSPSPHKSLLVQSVSATFTWATAPTDGKLSFPRHYAAVTRTTGAETPMIWSKGKCLGRALQAARFEVGDAIAVTLQGGQEGIGILVDLWEEETPESDAGRDSGEEMMELTRKMTKVHWCYRKEDLPEVMRTVRMGQNEVFLAASPKRPVISTLPLGLMLRTVILTTGACDVAAHEQPKAGPSTPARKRSRIYAKDKTVAPVAVVIERTTRGKGEKKEISDLWCSRAFDKAARGGRAWPINVEEWIATGKSGHGWGIEIPPPEVNLEPELDAKEKVLNKGKRRARLQSASDSDDDSDFEQEEGAVSEGEGHASGGEGASATELTRTPRKRKRSEVTTPRKTKTGRTSIKAKGTPRKKRKTAFLPASARAVDPAKLPVNPYERALRLLHVGATPDTLPCREEEFVDVLTRVEEGVESGGGGCLYIAGVPGTGKTATVHAVVKELRRKAEDGELPPFSYVEINGLKIPSPQHAYVMLWEAISGTPGASAKTALRGLEAHFASSNGIRGPRGHTFVVLMDELDQLLTAKQDVVYNFFNWPAMRDSQIFVVAVANRMDLPQQLAAKVKSRLGLQTLLFQPYDKASLIEIVKSRMIPHPKDPTGLYEVLTSDAVALAATKMAGTNGDARRVLDACRRAVEIAMEQEKPHAVTIREMSDVLSLMSKSPVSLFLKQCSVQQKIMMASVLRCVRREGVPEIAWRAIRNDIDALTRSLLDGAELLTSSELALILAGLTASHALTYNYDLAKSLDDRKLALGLESGEVGRVLMDEGDGWRRALAGT